MPDASVTRRAFLHTASAAVVAASGGVRAGARAAADGVLYAYVGTYSSPPVDASTGKAPPSAGNGRGIHIFTVDRTTGALTPAGVAEHHASPSALAIDAAGARLYTANETDATGATPGSLSAFGINRRTGQLTLLNTVASGGAGPTYVSLHRAGRHLFTANYAGGTVAVCPVLEDGRLGAPTDVQRTVGAVGPTRATNAPPGSFAISGHDAPHPHMIQDDPSGRFVIAPDLGLDRLFVWRFDADTGTLTPNEPASVTLPPGDGPRHFAFHPNGRWLYSIQEEASTVALFDYAAATGTLTRRQMLSSLPDAYAGSSFASGILVSADGRFVYAGNRLHDSVAIFAVGAVGTLTRVGESWTHGSYPRSLAFDPSGHFLYVCNQRADVVAAFRVDRATGHLAFAGQYTPVGSPSAIAFLEA